MKKTLLFLFLTSLFACTQKPTEYAAKPAAPVTLTVNAKIRLENNSEFDWMSNYYQEHKLLPTVSPFKNRMVADTGFTSYLVNAATTGSNAIVDWVVVELREDAFDHKRVIQTRQGFVQADGDVVGLDGISPIKFEVLKGSYYVSLKQRNHLGIRTLNKYSTNQNTLNLNFTNNSVPLNGQFNVIASHGYMTMIYGDANNDGSIDAFDLALWEQQNGLYDDYNAGADFNLDGSVDALDSRFLDFRNGFYEEVE